MSLSLGLFDVFTYTIPGSLYLTLAVYVTSRLHWVDVAELRSVPTAILFGGVLIACYITGFIANPLAGTIDRRMRWWKAIRAADARTAFITDVPEASNRPFVQANTYLLLAIVETNSTDAASEISRLRATGLMLRNCSIPLLAASIVSIAEAASGGQHTPEAILAAVVFATGALSGLWQGRRLRTWAEMKTLQLCYWIPGIDEMIMAPPPTRKRPRRPSTGGAS